MSRTILNPTTFLNVYLPNTNIYYFITHKMHKIDDIKYVFQG